MSKSRNIIHTNDLYDKIISMDNLHNSFKKAFKGNNKYNNEALRYYTNLEYMLRLLYMELVNETYIVDDNSYVKFKVYDPKEREIMAPKFKHKLVQYSIYNILHPILDRKYINTSYACIVGRGTHRGALEIQRILRKENRTNYNDEKYVLKLDIQKFFYSIDRSILKKIVKNSIKDKRLVNLLYLIIDSSPSVKGLPLGNLTSQIFGNLYLNKLDHYIKRVLRIKSYIRYMDDMILIVNNKKEAIEVYNEISRFLKVELNLILNEKKSIYFPLKNAKVNSLGYVISVDNIRLRKYNKEKIKGKLKKFPRLLVEGKITKKKVLQIFYSFYGHAQIANHKAFINYLMKRFYYLKKDRNGKFYIHMGEVHKYYNESKKSNK